MMTFKDACSKTMAIYILYILYKNIGPITVSVSVVAPSQVNTEFTGKVKIINSGNASDFCEIDVSLSTSRNRISNFMQYILERLSFLKILFDNLRRILS